MGIRSDLRALASMSTALMTHDATAGIRSPWQVRNLMPVVWNDVFGIKAPGISRDEALSIPGVYRARAILLSLIADKPLTAWRKDQPVTPAPTFLQHTTGIYGPWQRMAQTLDDLIFYGYSLWAVDRAERPDGIQPILGADRIPWDDWTIDDDGRILVRRGRAQQFAPVDQESIILIPGPSEGLLAYAARTMRGAAELEQTWVSRAANPSPLTELHLTDNAQLEDDEVVELQQQWASARRSPDGAVAVTPVGVELIDHGQSESSLFIEGRNSSRLDIAAFFNLPGAILDASTATASLTYVTQEGTRTSVYDLSLPYWVRPIEARLSQDDVVPAGQSVRFDFSTLTPQAQIVTED